MDKVARWIAFSSLAVAAISAFVAYLSYQETTKTNRLSSRIEARELLNSALDMIGGAPGTETFLLPGGAPDEENRRILERAKRKIEKALDLAPDFYMAYEYYGLYLHLTGDPENALSHHEKAIDLNEDDGWPYAAYSNTLRSVNRHGDAIDALRQAIELEPENPHFHRNLGLIAWDLGRIQEAETHFAAARRFASKRGISLTFPGDQ